MILFIFHFKDIEQPITIEADTKEEARHYLNAFIQDKPDYRQQRVINEKMVTPVPGVTRKKKGDKMLIWFSNGITQGWVDEQSYNDLIKPP